MKTLLITSLLILLAGCASVSSTERMSTGKKSSTYCFDESIDTVANKINESFANCYSAPVEDHSFVADLSTYSKGRMVVPDIASRSTLGPRGKTLVETFQKNRKVSLIRGIDYILVANITDNEADPSCRTSVEYYTPSITVIGGERRFLRIEQYIKTHGASGC